jgi:hypothetical protein
MGPDETVFCFSIFVFTLTGLVSFSSFVLIRYVSCFNISTFYLICPEWKFNFSVGVTERKVPVIKMPFDILQRKNVNGATNRRNTQHRTVLLYGRNRRAKIVMLQFYSKEMYSIETIPPTMAWRMMLLMMTSKQCRFWYIRSFGL